jgi:hypothetical protein
MTANYTISVKVEDSFKSPPSQPPVTLGFYPLRQNIQEFLEGTSAGVQREVVDVHFLSDNLNTWQLDIDRKQPPAAVHIAQVATKYVAVAANQSWRITA